jgi:hypothetical protein
VSVRAEFEAHISREVGRRMMLREGIEDGEYVNPSLQSAWADWQAAYAAGMAERATKDVKE